MTRSQTSPSVPQRLLSAYRIGLGLLFASHGGQSLVDGAAGAARWVALAQLVSGILMLAGVRTRVAALLCVVVTGYGFLLLHGTVLWPAKDGAEATALFSWGLLLLAAYGPGTWTYGRLRSAVAAALPQPVIDPVELPDSDRPAA